MKTRTNKHLLTKGISVGAALVAGGAGFSGSRQAPIVVTNTVAAIGAAPVTRMNSNAAAKEVAASSYVPKISEPLRTGWTKTDAKKIQALAVKRALGRATTEEHAQFEQLRSRRRASEVVPAIEIIAEWHRRRFITEVLSVLSKNVRFFKPEDQARLAALR